jgi:hypothetical protein
MIEFIRDTYWIKNNSAQYKDIRDRFSLKPFLLSEGSVSNYIEELVDEKKIRKVRDGNNVYYCPPKMSAPLKLILVISIICGGISLPLFAFYNIILLYVVGFYFGVLFACFIWLINRKEAIQKNGFFHRNPPENTV